VVMLQSKLAACTDAACKTLMENFLLRHWNAELSATNQLTYYLAEDLARNSAYALPYIGRIEEFSGWLKRATDVGTQSDAQTKYYAVDDDYKYYLRDTYLYADMVLEARKANPSVDHFKKLKHDFEQIVEHVEESKADVPNLRKVDLTLVKIAHAHYASARDLAGE
jgi:hypothetical protein